MSVSRSVSDGTGYAGGVADGASGRLWTRRTMVRAMDVEIGERPATRSSTEPTRSIAA
ncbi:hypothetical protein [Azospirillum sp. A26]|uniref:hypothetical protein n=1 Tax=Azospirillum sp. A26 TaxID=3160607 RepID=UPI00366D2CC4